MSIIFYYNKFYLSKYSGSWVVSIKQNMKVNIQLPSTFVFLVFQRNYFIKSCSSFEYVSAYKMHGPALTGTSFVLRG
jgi:hypothetical protein